MDYTTIVNAVTGELTPTPGPNRVLPPLNPLKARSTIAAVLSFLSLIAPMLGGGLGEIVASILANADLIQSESSRAVDAVNVLIGGGAAIWFWLERRAPNFRLSLKG